jgi:hypothetical protein
MDTIAVLMPLFNTSSKHYYVIEAISKATSIRHLATPVKTHVLAVTSAEVVNAQLSWEDPGRESPVVESFCSRRRLS